MKNNKIKPVMLGPRDEAPVFFYCNCPNNQDIQKLVFKKVKKSACFKWTYGLTGKYYRVATFPKLYLSDIGIIMQGFKSMG